MDKEFAKVIDNIDDMIKEYENEKINYKRVDKFRDLGKYSNLFLVNCFFKSFKVKGYESIC